MFVQVLSKELFLKVFVQVLSKGGLQVKITKTTVAVSRGCPKRRNPTMTTSTITARRKGDPQNFGWEKPVFYRRPKHIKSEN